VNAKKEPQVLDQRMPQVHSPATGHVALKKAVPWFYLRPSLFICKMGLYYYYFRVVLRISSET
jgi:hypothetical protein